MNDKFVVYKSEGRFVAHSLYTDQIGIGESVESAIYELILSLFALLEEHKRDSNVQIRCNAPEDVQKLYRDSHINENH